MCFHTTVITGIVENPQCGLKTSESSYLGEFPLYL